MNFAWEIFYGIGALVLLGALAYGMIQYKTRNRAMRTIPNVVMLPGPDQIRTISNGGTGPRLHIRRRF